VVAAVFNTFEILRESTCSVQRICFQLKIRPDRLDEYVSRHEHVWPEMRDALHDAGWNNYSLFVNPDGTLIGYLETEDFIAAQEAMAKTEINSRWQNEMAEFFEDLDGRHPDQGMFAIREIFHID
jgi:L-rhamnose mutarotase